MVRIAPSHGADPGSSPGVGVFIDRLSVDGGRVGKKEFERLRVVFVFMRFETTPRCCAG